MRSFLQKCWLYIKRIWSCLKRGMKCMDWLALAVGIVAFVCNIIQTDYPEIDNFLCYLAGVFGFIYLINVAILFLFFRPRFDWHLIYGHSLRKVCCLILLFPFILTIGSDCFVDEPEKLVNSTSLYGDDVKVNETPDNDSPNKFWVTYFHFMDPGNQHSTTTKSARIWAAVIAILGVFLLNGLLVSTFVGWIDNRKGRWLRGGIKYKGFMGLKRHYIVIGGNDMVAGIVKQLLPNGKYILIQTSSNVEQFRRELFSSLSKEEQQLIIIYYGSRNSEEDLKELCLQSAEEVYILGEETRTDDVDSYHDTMNMECLNLLLKLYQKTSNGREITAMLERRDELRKQSEAERAAAAMKLDSAWRERKQLNCRVMFEYQTTFSVFQFFDIDEQMDAYINFDPFNYYEMWAQNVLINKELNSVKVEENFRNGGYLPLEGKDGIKYDDDDYVHLFIVGMSRMGVAMAIEAAHLAHYPNYVNDQKRIRTKITLIDKAAAEEKNFFMGRFKDLFALSHWRYATAGEAPQLQWYCQDTHHPSGCDHLGGDFLDIEWEFISGGVEQAAIQNYILSTAETKAKITIAICLPESNRAHAAALFLHKKIYESERVQQVLVYNRYGNSIVGAISTSGSQYPYCGKLRGFGSSQNCIVLEHLKQSDAIGRKIAEAYNGGPIKSSFMAERGQFKGKSKAADRWSSTYNGNTLWTKLRCVAYKENDSSCIDLLSKVEHNRWNVEELLMNFRSLTEPEQKMVLEGEVKKNDLKGEMAHLDICSNERLLEVDRDIIKYDVTLTKCLLDIHKSLMGDDSSNG